MGLARRAAIVVACFLLGAATAQCPPQSKQQGTGDSIMCLCNPGYIDSVAGPCTTKTPCPEMAPVTQLSLNSYANITSVTVNDSRVIVVSEIAQYANRVYNEVLFGTCRQGQNNLTFSIVSPNDASCLDRIEATLPVISLELCGFNATNITEGGSTFAKYDGVFQLNYNELVNITDLVNQTFLRNSSIFLPTTISLENQFTSQFTAGAVRVVSKYDITGIIVYQDSPFIGSTQMQLQLLINAQRPYAVVSIPNSINQTGLAAANGSLSYFIKGQNRGVIPASTTTINYCMENADETCTVRADCTPTTSTTCYACTETSCGTKAWVLVLFGNACQLNDQFVIKDVGIACSANIANIDCPLNGDVDASTIMTFTVESAFICLDPSLISTLGSANVANFIAVFSDDLRRKFPGPQNPKQQFVYNDVMFLRMDFDNFKLYAAELLAFKASVNNAGWVESPVRPQVNGTIPARYGTTSRPPSNQFGLDFIDQSFLMRTFVNGNLSAVLSPTLAFTVSIQAVMSLNYQSEQTNAGAPGTRRRRMVFFEERLEHHVTERQSSSVPPSVIAPIAKVGVAPYYNPDASNGGTSTVEPPAELAPTSGAADCAKAPALVVLAMALICMVLV